MYTPPADPPLRLTSNGSRNRSNKTRPPTHVFRAARATRSRESHHWDFREGVIRVDKKRVLLLLFAAAVVIVGAAASQLSAGTRKLRAASKAPRVVVRPVNPSITRRYRTTTSRWQALKGMRRGPSSRT